MEGDHPTVFNASLDPVHYPLASLSGILHTASKDWNLESINRLCNNEAYGFGWSFAHPQQADWPASLPTGNKVEDLLNKGCFISMTAAALQEALRPIIVAIETFETAVSCLGQHISLVNTLGIGRTATAAILIKRNRLSQLPGRSAGGGSAGRSG